ncbi:MAG: UPF0104 family protein [Wenzhouxiangella sp.]|nr:MAG: UPF0104 family protein [Wenzhouxiangella sp.]
MSARPWLRWGTSLALLAALLIWLEPERIAAEVTRLEPAWLVLALIVATAQTVLSAWRWRYTAGRLGLELEPRAALAEYYLAGFVNQVLPGGVLGDAWRARRHARASGRGGPAWRAVILERASGQVVVIALAVLALVAYRPWREILLAAPHGAPPWPLGLGLIVIMALVVVLRPRWQPLLAILRRDIRRALLARDAWPRQLASSLLIVLSYLLVFAACARGIGVELPIAGLMLLALPILLAMLVPLTVAGWGFREGAAAAVWLAAGLAPEQGVAASLAYGVTVLLASLPGAAVLAFGRSAKAHVDE